MLKKSITLFFTIMLLSIGILSTSACNSGPTKPEIGTEFTVTFDLGICKDEGAEITAQQQTVKYGEHYELYEPTCEGYIFVKWVRIVNDIQQIDFNSIGTYSLEDDVTLIAQWQEIDPEIPTYTITYIPWDDRYPEVQSLVNMPSLTQTVEFGKPYELYIPTISSYNHNFESWLRVDDGSYAVFKNSGTYDIQSDITLQIAVGYYVGNIVT